MCRIIEQHNFLVGSTFPQDWLKFHEENLKEEYYGTAATDETIDQCGNEKKNIAANCQCKEVIYYIFFCKQQRWKIPFHILFNAFYYIILSQNFKYLLQYICSAYLLPFSFSLAPAPFLHNCTSLP
jgi:hypothetical protein